MGFGEALSRRQLLRLGLISGAAVAVPGLLAGCQRGKDQLLAAVEGQFPQAWSQQLPAGWQTSWLGDPEAVGRSKAALWSLSDGWASLLPRQQIRPIGVDAELQRLAPWTGPVSRLFTPEGSPALAFPWAFSPWVLVLRNRPDLAQRRAEGWELLLDPSLKGQLVLPSSPRVAMALLGNGLEPLMALRGQALAYDERDGLNLLLSGEAQALVTPLQRVIPCCGAISVSRWCSPPREHRSPGSCWCGQQRGWLDQGHPCRRPGSRSSGTDPCWKACF